MGRPAYGIDVDDARRLVRATLHGLWTLDDVRRYAVDLARIVARMASSGGVRVLIDLRGHAVQPREVSEAIQREIAGNAWLEGRHAVLLSASALQRLQAQRIGAQLSASLFDDEAKAIDWLIER